MVGIFECEYFGIFGMFFKDLTITQRNSGKFKVTQGSFFDLMSGNPDNIYISWFQPY